MWNVGKWNGFKNNLCVWRTGVFGVVLGGVAGGIDPRRGGSGVWRMVALLSVKPIRNAARLLALLNTPRHSRVGGAFLRP